VDSIQTHATNLEVQHRMNQPPVADCYKASELIWPHRPCRSSRRSCSCTVSLYWLPTQGLERPQGCPRHTWLWMVEQDLRTHNLGLWTALQRDQNRVQWLHASWWWW